MARARRLSPGASPRGLREAVVDEALEPIVTVDATGRIVDFNLAAENTFRYPAADVLGRLAGDLLVPPRLRERYDRELARLRGAESPLQPRTVDSVARRADGSEFPVEIVVGRVVVDDQAFLTAFIRDTTERHEAQASLAHLASLVRSSSEAIIGEAPDGTITSWNSGAETIFGYADEEIIGRHVSMLLRPEQTEGVESTASQSGEGLEQREVVGVTKEGRHIRLAVTSSPVVNHRGETTGRATIARDITADRAAAAEREELQQQLHQSQKMQAIGRLAGGVAHDFNNLLAVIINYANFLADDLEESSAEREDVERIRQAANSAVGLVRQLLLFSRQDALEPQVVDINQLVLDMEKLLRRVLGEDVELETRLATDLQLTKIDPGQTEQILMNLAVNTRDAMPNGGTLAIDTSNATADEYFAQQHGIQPGDYVRLTVTDTGCGMDADTLAHIFEPFFTTKTEGEGTGLGLATVYAIAQRAGGCVTVQSELGVGTTFDIYLPATDEEEDKPLTIDTASGRAGNGETVLVVEDSDEVRVLAERILSTHGYEVLSARSGRHALEVCEAHTGPLDLLLSDVIMPHMSGQELVRWLRRAKEGFATLFMSGYTEERATVQGLDFPVTFLQKPFTEATLLAKVHEALESASSGREMPV